MSHPTIKTACVVAGFAVAALAATSAQAAKPLSVKQKNEMAEQMARTYQARQATAKLQRGVAKTAAPKTLSAPGGGTGMEVPDDLHNYLSVQRNADGTLRVIETDGTTAPVVQAAEASNEK